MLDFESLTRIDKEALRQSAWSKAMIDPISEYLSDHPPSVDEWFRHGDDYEKHFRELLKTSRHFQNLFGQRAALLGDNRVITNPRQYLEELGLACDKMPTKEELKARYFTLVKQHHPDIHPGNAEAVENFKRVQTAYENTTALYEHVEREAAAQETKIREHFASHKASKGWHNGSSSAGKPAASFPVDHLATEQKEALANALRAEGYSVEEHFAADIGSNVISVSGAFKGRSASAEIVKKLESRFTTGVKPVASATHQGEKQPASTSHSESTAEAASGPTETKRLEGTVAKSGHSKSKATDTSKEPSKSKKAAASVGASESEAADALKNTSRSKKAAASVGVCESEAAEPLKHTAWSEKASARPSVSKNKMADALKKAAKSGEEATAKAGGETKWIVGGIIAAVVAIGSLIAYKRKGAVEREQERRENNTADRNIG